MNTTDTINPKAECELFRAQVSCAALLEREAWKLDPRESTKNCLKYRRGPGEVLIVNHEGRGWWDPQSEARGDVMSLVQHLRPGLTFGQVRVALRKVLGIVPTFPEALHKRKTKPTRPVSDRWRVRPRLTEKSSTWRYLATERCLPENVLHAVARADAVREGHFGTAWFAHQNETGSVCHVELRGPDIKTSLSGGAKTLFRFNVGAGTPNRLVVTEAPIDALSIAAIEDIRDGTLYAATGGGMGPGTINAIECILEKMTLASADAVLVSATDANHAGDLYGARQAVIASSARARFERLRPPEGLDWNDVLKQGRAV